MLQTIIILFGVIIAFNPPTMAIGISVLAIGFALFTAQINAYNSSKQNSIFEDMKKQLDRVEIKGTTSPNCNYHIHLFTFK
jgi:hypothetical protein